MRQNPWLGLATYDETLISQGYKFCGRERAINELYSIIDNNIFTTLYGKSGIGKSSLLQAGIFPLFRYNNYLPVLIRLGVSDSKHSSSSYVDAIINAIETSIKDNNMSATTADSSSPAKEEEKLWHYFHHTQFRNSNNEVIFPVIVLDQFEELYYRDKSQLKTLFKALYYLLDDTSINSNRVEQDIINYRIVISIREDDLFHLEDSIDNLRLAEMKDNRYRLREFSEDEAYNVISVPGKDVFNTQDIDAIASKIITETKANGNEINSAVLSLINSRIFSSAKEDRLITLDDVNLFFKDAQGNYLKSFYEEIKKNLSSQQWYYIEDNLVTDEGRRDSVLQSDFDKAIPNSKWLFEGERSMLRRVTVQGSAEPRIEIIHDMLAIQMLSSKKERKLQEQAKKLRRQRLIAFAIFVIIASIGYIFYTQYRSIIEERNNMYKMQSHYITEKAEKLIEKGDIYTAIRLLLNVLPNDIENPNRPYITDAELCLRKCNIVSHNPIKLTQIIKHSGSIQIAQFSPDGKYLITSSDRTAKIWDTKTGKQIGKDLIHSSRVNSAQFSPNGKYILTTAYRENLARIWDTQTGKEIGDSYRPTEDIHSPQFSPSGKYFITISWNGKAQLWITKTGQEIRYKLEHTRAVNSAQFSPNEKYIVTTSDDNTIKIWDIESGKQIGNNLTHRQVNLVQFSSNNKYIITTANYNPIAKIWNIETGKQIGDDLWHSPSDGVNSIQFSPDGELIVTASHNIAEIWNVKTGRQIGNALTHPGVNSVQFSPDGKYLITSSAITAKIWNTKTGKQIKNNQINDDIKAVFSPNGKYVVSKTFNRITKIWELETGQQIGNNLNHSDIVSIQFSSNNKYLITKSSESTKIWELETGQQIGDAITEWDTQFNPNEEQIISKSYNTVIIRTLRNNTRNINKDIIYHWNLKFSKYSPNGEYIVTASSGNTAKIWDVKTGEQIGKDLIHSDYVNSAQFSPKGEYIVTVSSDNTAKIWNVKTGEQIGKDLKHKQSVKSAQFSPNGELIVTASNDGTGKIWNLKGEQIKKDLKHSGWVLSAQFSPNGEYIVTASGDRSAKIWNAKTGKQIGENLRHSDAVDFAKFSSDGKLIITTTSYNDKATRIWDTYNQKQRGYYSIRADEISPDGHYIMYRNNHMVKFTEFIPLEDLIDRYKELFGDWSLTEEELKKYNFK